MSGASDATGLRAGAERPWSTPNPAAGAVHDDTAADGLIRPMPDVLASKIAAGEVVQRPASVAKELMENALDSGARRIDLVVRRAGSGLVQVVDDGCGMGPQDAETCFGRHATSKLRSFDDLEHLATLGFRGEALASIAAVARVELRTRRAQDDSGTCVRVEAGRIEERRPCPADAGTSIAVRDLFYNVPARRAFLRAPATEFRHLVDTFQAIALSEPTVAFTLVHDDVEVYRLDPPAEDASFDEALLRRVGDLFGARDEQSLIAVRESTSYLTLRGFVGPPDQARKGRNDGFIFVNGRPVKHRSLEHAVLQSYGSLLPEGRRPFFALFLDVNPRHVDVNVHPAKTEVKFDDEGGVYAFVRAVVKRGLGAANLTLLWGDAAVPDQSPDFESHGARVRWSAPVDPSHPPRATGDGGWSSPLPGPIPSRIASDPTPASAEADDAATGAILAIHGRYLLTAIRSGLIVVDQQAAHARILFERAMTALEGGLAASQQLLFPHALELDPGDRELLHELAGDLRALGFALELGAGRTVILRGVPSDVRLGSEARVLHDVIAAYREAGSLLPDDRHSVLARALARRNAVPAGHVLKLAEARTLIDQLFACSEPYVDPDGRPTMTRLSLEDLERRFLRPSADDGS